MGRGGNKEVSSQVCRRSKASGCQDKDDIKGASGGGGDWDIFSLIAPVTAKSLIRFEDLPDWAQDNNLIKTGYRPVRACHWHCLESLLYLHNETANIYSHGLPCVLGLFLACHSLFIHLPALHASLADTLAFLPLLLGELRG